MNNHIIAFAGSNSPNSINEQLTKAAVKNTSIEDVEYIDLKHIDIQMYGKEFENRHDKTELAKLKR